MRKKVFIWAGFWVLAFATFWAILGLLGYPHGSSGVTGSHVPANGHGTTLATARARETPPSCDRIMMIRSGLSCGLAEAVMKAYRARPRRTVRIYSAQGNSIFRTTCYYSQGTVVCRHSRTEGVAFPGRSGPGVRPIGRWSAVIPAAITEHRNTCATISLTAMTCQFALAIIRTYLADPTRDLHVTDPATHQTREVLCTSVRHKAGCNLLNGDGVEFYGPDTRTAQATIESASSGSTTNEPVEQPGSSTHATDKQFCSTHSCIPSFADGNGYIVQCQDGEWSHSGGLSGACSDHGG